MSECLTISVPEAAARLGISRSQGYEMVKDGTIPALWFGKTVRVPRGVIERMVEAASEPKSAA